MNPNALLALIGDLYGQVAQLNETEKALRAENEQLRAALGQRPTGE